MSEKIYYLYADIASQALAAMRKNDSSVNISVDLNLTVEQFAIKDEKLILEDNISIDSDDLKKIVKKDNKVFFRDSTELDVLEISGEGHYKLVPTTTAPYLEISGVKMHISKGICPYESAGLMAKQVVKSGHEVLDTCSGLGYAASSALACGAKKIISVEKSADVIAIRKLNPWSQKIYSDKLALVNADINEFILGLKSASFDSIIHDPPRFSLAGELYSEAFYREMFRVLKPRGTLFHYTGNPNNKGRGKNFLKNCTQRLKNAGFKKITYIDVTMGFFASK